MRQCPECGFRAEDKNCPLCGVAMKPVAAASRALNTHSHRQPGEDCLLPKKEEKNFQMPTARERQRQGNPKELPSKLVSTIVIIVIAILMRSCAA